MSLRRPREYTNRIIELVDEGVLDRDELIRDLLMWLPERDVEEFFQKIDFNEEDEDATA
jgi:hypothetical protein